MSNRMVMWSGPPPSDGRPAARWVWVAGGCAAGLAAAAIWAACSVVSRMLVSTSALSPADLALLRYAGAFPIAAALLAMFPRRLANNISFPRFVILMLLAGPAYQALLIFGYGFVPAGSGALIVNGMLPIFSMLYAAAAAALLGSRSRGGPSAVAICGAAAVIAGLWLNCAGASAATAWTVEGFAIFAAAAAMWALLNTLIARWSIDPLRLTLWLVLWSPLFLPLWFALSPTAIPGADLGRASTLDILAQVAVHGWLGALVATVLFLHAVRVLGAPTAAVLQAATPALAAWFGNEVLHEPVTTSQTAGLALVFAGMVLAIIARDLQLWRPDGSPGNPLSLQASGRAQTSSETTVTLSPLQRRSAVIAR